MEIGDNVKIVNYGHLVWESKTIPGARSKAKAYYENDKFAWIDMAPHIVGRTGKVFQKIESQGRFLYSLSGVTGKQAWFEEDQLQKI